MKRLMEVWLSSVGVVGILLAQGCEQNVGLTERKIRKATVRSVTHYGLTLDQQASPKQVAYAALRAIREDVLAASEAERDAALDKQIDLAAANVIAASNRSALGRDEYVQDVVLHWTPTISHYAADLETEWEKAQPRLVRTPSRPIDGDESGAMSCNILMELADPEGDPNASVVLVIRMAQDRGFWRVVHLRFEPGVRVLRSTRMTPAQSPSP